ncbi:helix-turn-helix transcriptional regulator [Cohaesibacter celericrescens]|uniref:helix-turn-helix transcriptional regulator n=1 Tax=Cohaesibacter celericrescens TaxID=2067669 RepID=UPI00356299E8
MGEKIDTLIKLREETFDAIRNAETVELAITLFRDSYHLGHVTYHLAQTIAGELQIDSPYVRTTYPSDWVARYLMRGYVNVDPVIKEGMLRSLPFDWAEIEPSEAAIAMLIDFQDFGLGAGGYSIPITDKVGRRALLSLNSKPAEDDWDKIVAQYKQDWAELAHVLHKKAIFEQFGDNDPAPVLSPRELETLYWTAQGKDYKEIAIIIGISEHTVRTYMRSARYKLDCSNLSQAVAKAIKLRLIQP